nr:unnamed protein product [Callosobruchus analis]
MVFTIKAARTVKQKNLSKSSVNLNLWACLLQSSFGRTRQLIDDGVSIRQAAEAVRYHESTLRQRLKTGKGVESLGRYKAILSQAQENEVVQHCKTTNDFLD